MGKTYGVVVSDDGRDKIIRVSARDADEAQRMAVTYHGLAESSVTEVYRWFSDPTEVQQAVTASGDHWFDRSAMRLFGTRVGRSLYAGRYFVTSDLDAHGVRRYSARRVIEREGGTFSVETVGKFGHFTSRSGADTAARTAAYPRMR